MPDRGPNATPLPTSRALARLIAVFLHPHTLVREIRARPTVRVPIVASLMAWNLIAVFMFRDRFQTSLEELSDGARGVGGERQAATEWVERHPGLTRAAIHGIVSIGWIVALVGWAGLLHVSAQQHHGAADPPVRFEHHMSLVAHAIW